MHNLLGKHYETMSINLAVWKQFRVRNFFKFLELIKFLNEEGMFQFFIPDFQKIIHCFPF